MKTPRSGAEKAWTKDLLLKAYLSSGNLGFKGCCHLMSESPERIPGPFYKFTGRVLFLTRPGQGAKVILTGYLRAHLSPFSGKSYQLGKPLSLFLSL